jgi:hypothetical protein
VCIRRAHIGGTSALLQAAWPRRIGKAGAASEQFAVGSCAYYIHEGEDPDFTLINSLDL